MNLKLLSALILVMCLGQTAFAEPPPKPAAENFSFDPFHQNWNDSWRRKIADYSVTIPKGNRVTPENVRALFTPKAFDNLRAKTVGGPLLRIVKEIKTQDDKNQLLRTFGEKEGNTALSLFTSLASNLPGLEVIGWVQWLDQVVDSSSAIKNVTKTRTTFANIAALGGKIVYHEAISEASDGRWLLLRGLYYTVPLGLEVKVLPLNYSRTLIEIVK